MAGPMDSCRNPSVRLKRSTFGGVGGQVGGGGGAAVGGGAGSGATVAGAVEPGRVPGGAALDLRVVVVDPAWPAVEVEPPVDVLVDGLVDVSSEGDSVVVARRFGFSVRFGASV